VIELFQVAYDLADTLRLGRHSAAVVGATSPAFPLVSRCCRSAAGSPSPGRRPVARRDDRRGERLTTVKPARPIDGSEGP
jgi:hypothetical protein